MHNATEGPLIVGDAPLSPGKYVHLFFMDGVGLGVSDPAVNPFTVAHMPYLTGLFGEGWYIQNNGRFANGKLSTPHATLIPTDPNLGVPGRP